MMKKLLKISALIIIICFPFSVNAQDVKYSGGDGDGYSYSTYENKGVPGSFSAAAGVNAIQLTWQQNTDTDNVIIAYNTSNTFGDPQDGNSYSVSDVLSGGGTIIFNGSGTSYLHTGLSATTTYYYKAWSVSGTTYSTSGVTANAVTQTLAAKYSGGSGDGYASAETGQITLPVELTSFSASVNENKVTLKWKTETEVNNYGFEIERASTSLSTYDGVTPSVVEEWVKIGSVKGAGNSNSPKSYSFTDHPTGGTSFSYRLKQIDNDGTFKYSDVVEVSYSAPEKFALEQNFPNPFNPTTKIKYSIPRVGTSFMKFITLKVYDILGKEVATLVNEQKPAGNYEVEFNASGLSSGVYYYRITAGNFTATKKLILLR